MANLYPIVHPSIPPRSNITRQARIFFRLIWHIYRIYSCVAQLRNAGEKDLKIRVQYLGFIKNMLNKTEEHFELEEGASLSDLLSKLAGIYGASFRKEVYEPSVNKIKTGFSVTINGIFIGQLGGLDAKLSDGDQVLLMSLVTGG